VRQTSRAANSALAWGCYAARYGTHGAHPGPVSAEQSGTRRRKTGPPPAGGAGRRWPTVRGVLYGPLGSTKETLIAEATPLPNLPLARRRRIVARALLRAFGSAAILVVLYYVLPLDHLSSATSILALMGGLVAVVAVIVWEVRAVLNAEYPGAQAIEALAVTVPLFLLLFSTGYFLMEHASPTSFTQHLSRTDALYFTVTTFATVGYGDITAKSETARVVVIFQSCPNQTRPHVRRQ